MGATVAAAVVPAVAPAVAIVLGGAIGTFDEAERAVGIAGAWPVIIVGTNDAGADWPGRLDHLVSFHTEKIGAWLERRAAAGRNVDCLIWTAEHKGAPEAIRGRLGRVPSVGGSSGLLATTVALRHARVAILCGIPMEAAAAHYHAPGEPWREAGQYRAAWTRLRPQIAPRVRSWAGWTGRTFGMPTKEWIDAACA